MYRRCSTRPPLCCLPNSISATRSSTRSASPKPSWPTYKFRTRAYLAYLPADLADLAYLAYLPAYLAYLASQTPDIAAGGAQAQRGYTTHHNDGEADGTDGYLSVVA